MPKTPIPQTKTSRIIMACAVIAAMATAVIVVIVLLAERTQAPAGTMQTTLSGTFVCLPHKGDGPSTLECAYGLRTEDGRHYAVQFDSFPIDIEMDRRVEITGSLTSGVNNVYDTVGSVKVQSYHYY